MKFYIIINCNTHLRRAFMMNTFGDKINYLRKCRQKTQDEIAVAVGTTKSTISKYERNLVEPTLESAKNIADYFMVSLDWLAGSGDYKNIKQNIPSDVFNRYIEVIEKAVSQEVSADNLGDAVNFISKVKNSRINSD